MALPRISQPPTDPDFVQDPYPFYDRVRALGPLVHWEEYGLPVAAGHAEVHALLRDRRLGREPVTPADPPPHLAPFHAVEKHSMLELEPPRHTRLRGLVMRAFTSRRIAALAPEIEILCHALIDDLPPGPADLLPGYCARVPVIVIARLLGVPEEMAPRLLSWSNDMVAMYQARRDRAVEDRAAAAAQAFSDYMRDYTDRRRRTPAKDLITELLAAESDGDRLTADELITTCILLLNAGHEATVHTLGNGIRALATHGPDPAWLTPDAIPGTVEEILRHDPPLHMFTRHVYEDMSLLGHQVQRGDQIGCLLAAANRDPAVWPDPARFDPTRPVQAIASFGAGIHFCVGAPLARLELQIALRVLFDRWPGLRLAEAPRYGDVYHFHGLRRLIAAPA